MCVGLFLIVVLCISDSHASEYSDNISWKDMEIKINSLLAKQKDEIEHKFNGKLLDRDRELEKKYNSLLRSHISMERKLGTMDKLTTVLRDQNEKLQTQVVELENIVSKTDKTEKCICRNSTATEPRNSVKRNLMAPMLTRNGELPVNQTLVARQQTPAQRKSLTKDMYNKRLLLPVTDSPTTTPTVPAHARVAFHAQLSSRLTDPGYNQHIEFGNVRTNVGNGYHRGSSTFICPVSGTYVFFVTMLSLPDKLLESEIVLNGKSELAYIYTYNDHHYNSGSTMVILDLKETDEVWVRVNAGEHHTGDVALEQWSSFSGFILWPNL